MSVRVKVDAGQVEAQEAWFVWIHALLRSKNKWGAWSSCPTHKAAANAAVSLAAAYFAPFLIARYIGDPEAVVVSREHPDGVPVEWVGGGDVATYKDVELKAQDCRDWTPITHHKRERGES